ncbi:MAG: MarR family transcriptional regulator [Bacteroidota bacterium]
MNLDKNLQDVVYYRIERTMRAVRSSTRKLFKEQGFGVNIDQWVLLKRISEEPQGLSQMELSSSTFKDPAAITRSLDNLVKKGLVHKAHEAKDRRAYSLTLTTEGLDLVKQMTPFVQDLRKQGLQDLEPQEVETLKKLLDKIYLSFET